MTVFWMWQDESFDVVRLRFEGKEEKTVHWDDFTIFSRIGEQLGMEFEFCSRTRFEESQDV